MHHVAPITPVLDHHPKSLGLPRRHFASGSARFQIASTRVVHRCGQILPGEPIVFAAAAARHRRAAFEAADYLMDRLKTEAMFWKREDGPDGSNWIEPTSRDYIDRDRWSEPCPE